MSIIEDQVLKFKNYLESLKPDYRLQSVTFYVLRDDGGVERRDSPCDVRFRGGSFKALAVFVYKEHVGAKDHYRYFHILLDKDFGTVDVFRLNDWELSIESNGFESNNFCFCIRNAKKGLSAKTKEMWYGLFHEFITDLWSRFVEINKVQTQEELDKAIKGLGKFTRTEVSNEPKYLWHYTRLNVLTKLQNWSGDSNDLTFHAIHYEFLNDATEFEKVVKAPHCIEKSMFMWGEASPFTISFCESNRLVHLWNMYGDNGCGVCLGFNRAKLEKAVAAIDRKEREENAKAPEGLIGGGIENDEDEKNKYIRLVKCSYKDTLELKELKNSFWSGEISNTWNIDGYREFVYAAIARKNRSFSGEKEWRIAKFSSKYSTRETGSSMIPYVEVKIPYDCLEKIVLGPKTGKRDELAVRKWEQGYSRSEVSAPVIIEKSKLPLW